MPPNIDLALRVIEAFSRRDLNATETALYLEAVRVLTEHLKGN